MYYDDYTAWTIYEKNHTGYDCPNPSGTKVGAAADGVVILVKQGWNTYSGWGVWINHGTDPKTGWPFNTFYTHLSSALVNPGDVVKKGDTIGLSGSPGDEAKAHLHWSAANQNPEDFSGYYEHASEQPDGRGWINPEDPPATIILPGQTVSISDRHAEPIIAVNTIGDLAFVQDMRTSHVLSKNLVSLADLTKVEGIIWHQTATGPFDSNGTVIDGIHLVELEANQGNTRPGYHVVCGTEVINIDNEAYAICQWLVDTDTQAWHALEYNQSYLAVSFVDETKEGPITEAQLRSFYAISAVWMKQFDLTADSVKGHGEVHPDLRKDPIGVDMDEARKTLGEAAASLVPQTEGNSPSDVQVFRSYEEMIAFYLSGQRPKTFIQDQSVEAKAIRFVGFLLISVGFPMMIIMTLLFSGSLQALDRRERQASGNPNEEEKVVVRLHIWFTKMRKQRIEEEGLASWGTTKSYPDRPWARRGLTAGLMLMTSTTTVMSLFIGIYMPVMPRPEALSQNQSQSTEISSTPILTSTQSVDSQETVDEVLTEGDKLEKAPESILPETEVKSPQSSPGKTAVSKIDLGNNHVITVNLDAGGVVNLLHGAVTEPKYGKGIFGGPEAKLSFVGMDPYYKELAKKAKASSGKPVCVINGSFFLWNGPAGVPVPTLNLPLKANGKVITEGWMSAPFNSDEGEKLLLHIWPGKVKWTALSKEAFYGSDAPDIIGVFSWDAPREGRNPRQRTFIGLGNPDAEGYFRQIVLYVHGDGITTKGMEKEMEELGFSEENILMIDGGGSTQIICGDGSRLVTGRPIPQAFGIFELGQKPVSTSTPSEGPGGSNDDVWGAICQQSGYQDCSLMKAFAIRGSIPRGPDGYPMEGGKVFPWWIAAGIPFGETNLLEWTNPDPLSPGPWGKYLGYTEYAKHADVKMLQACRDGLVAVAANPVVKAKWPNITAEGINSSWGCAIGRTQIWAGHFAQDGIYGKLENMNVWSHEIAAETTLIHLVSRTSGVCGSSKTWYDSGNTETALCAYNPGSWGVPADAWYWDAVRSQAAKVETAWKQNGSPTSPDRLEAEGISGQENETDLFTAEIHPELVVRPTIGSGPYAVWDTVPSLLFKGFKAIPVKEIDPGTRYWIEDKFIAFGHLFYGVLYGKFTGHVDADRMLGFYK